MENDYTIVTETPGTRASSEQITRLYTRYKFASLYCKDKDILEVACGTGIGLGYLAKIAKRVVGGDIDENNLKFARKHYKNRDNIEIKILDAHNLPFADETFDVVILYEAIYYLSTPAKFIIEAKRVLRKGGVLIISTANKDWSGFNPSSYSYKYFSAPELLNFFKSNRFSNIKLYGDSPVAEETVKNRVVSFIKKNAVALHLIPKTMKGKELLKRIVFGKLTTMPSEITDGLVEYSAPLPLENNVQVLDYKIIFAIGWNVK